MRIASIAIFCLLCVPVYSYAQPVISFQELQHDFGTLGEQEKEEYAFGFTNTGDQELVIERLTAS